jgi:glycosyltransferase involved in cell wall biosynthesis
LAWSVEVVSLIDIGIHVEGEPERLEATLQSLRRYGPGHVRPIVLLDQSLAVPKCEALIVSVRAGGAVALNALLDVSSSRLVALFENGARVAWGALDRLARVVRGDVAIAGPSTNLAWNEQRRSDAPTALARDELVERYSRSLAVRMGTTTRELSPLYSLGDFCYLARRDVLLALGGADEGFGAGPCWEMDLNIRAKRAGHRGLWVPGAYVHRAPISERRLAREAALLEISKRQYQDRYCGARLRGEKNDYRDHCRGSACPNFALVSFSAVPTKSTALIAKETDLALNASAPLVTCIMPTRDRPLFVVEAVKNFLAQDYPRKELVVVDDGENPVGALLPDDDRIVLVRLREALTVGEKRNIACERASGEIIAHFDDDDWYPASRLSTQVNALLERGAAISGTSRLHFLDARGGRAWLYSRPGACWVAGSTLVYRRSYWREHHFAPVSIGEDSRFLASGGKAVALVDIADPSLCVAMIHNRNTSPKRPAAPLWRPVALHTLRLLLGDRLRAYREALEAVALPLVSCVMATFDRPSFVALALAGFDAQTYPNKELVIVDDGTRSVEAIAEGRVDVRYHRLHRRASIGEKRNVGNSLAQGEIVCLWDDDDWYSPERIRYQTLPILYDEADLTGLKSAFLMFLPTGEVWSATDALHRSMFEGDVAGGTLTYGRAIAQRIRYPSTNLGEDASLIRRALRLGFRLKRLENGGRFIYMRHDHNTWLFELGSFLDSKGWHRASAPAGFEPSLLAAYQAAGGAAMIDA